MSFDLVGNQFFVGDEVVTKAPYLHGLVIGRVVEILTAKTVIIEVPQEGSNRVKKFRQTTKNIAKIIRQYE